MKEKKSTINRLFEFAESYDTDIIFVAFMFVLLDIIIAAPLVLNKISWAIFAPLALILVYLIARGILDLMNSYRWYFGIHKNKSKQKEQ